LWADSRKNLTVEYENEISKYDVNIPDGIKIPCQHLRFLYLVLQNAEYDHVKFSNSSGSIYTEKGSLSISHLKGVRLGHCENIISTVNEKIISVNESGFIGEVEKGLEMMCNTIRELGGQGEWSFESNYLEPLNSSSDHLFLECKKKEFSLSQASDEFAQWSFAAELPL